MKISVENMTIKREKIEILKNIYLKIEDQELVMLLGRNGCGKTTLLKVISGLLRPTKGRVCYDEVDISHFTARIRAQKISYIPQESEYLPHFTVGEFVLLGRNPYLTFLEQPKQKDIIKMKQALQRFQIEHLEQKFIDKISGGEKKLAYLARMILQNPSIMALDEPTSSLDYIHQYEFMKIMKQYLLESKKGAIVSVHDPNLALRYADKVIIIDNRQVVERLKRCEEEFELRLIKALNKIYQNHLQPVKTPSGIFIDWKEEAICLQSSNTEK